LACGKLGYVSGGNGGVIASIIDCHGTGTAAAAAYRAEQRAMDPDNLQIEEHE